MSSSIPSAVQADNGIGTIIIAGKPAGGKSTQCTRLLNQYGLVHVSAGDLLRSRQKVMPELANYMENGYLVPDDLVCSIVLQRISMRDCANGVLLDGFPRTRHQAEMLKKSGIKVNHFLLLEVPDEIVVERIGGRRVDPVSGVTYHMTTNRPKDSEILERLVQRKDDTKEKIEKRLIEYRKNIGELLEFYSPVLSVIHATVHPDRVFDRIRQVIEKDCYWGSSISRRLEVRNYETNNATLQDGSIDSQSISQYFEHLVYLMTTLGALGVGQSDLQEARFVVRAQAIELSLALSPGLQIGAHVWLENIGNTSVVLGHTLVTTRGAIDHSRRQAKSTNAVFPPCLEKAAATKTRVNSQDEVIEIARGSTILVAINSTTGKVVQIPQAKWLRNLVSQGAHGGVPKSLLQDFEPESTSLLPGNALDQNDPFLVLPLHDNGHLVEYTARSPQDRPESLRLKPGAPSPHAFNHTLVIEPADVDRVGVLRTSACVRYFQTVRFISGVMGGYDKDLKESSLAHTSLALSCAKPRYVWYEMLSKARVRDTLEVKTWVLPPTAELLRASGNELSGEEVNVSDLVLIGYQVSCHNKVLIRGCQGVNPRSTTSKL